MVSYQTWVGWLSRRWSSNLGHGNLQHMITMATLALTVPSAAVPTLIHLTCTTTYWLSTALAACVQYQRDTPV